MSLLEVKNLSVAFRSEGKFVDAVRNISFSVEKGKKLAIVGESGSGKSVTSLAIMGLLPEKVSRISSGEIFFGTTDLLKLDNEARRKLRGKDMAMIFQEPMTSLNPLLTCGEQVSETLKLHEGLSQQAAIDKTLELFEKVKLPRAKAMLKNYPHELSGGQKQRVMIAMAMACSPHLLIADEPTTALDVTVQGEILELIDDLVTTQDMGCVFITHDLGVVKQFADNVIVMYRGEIVEQGTVETIFNHPKEAYTKGLIACKPTLQTDNYRLPTVADFLSGKPISTEKKQVISHDQPLIQVQNLSVEYSTEKNWLGKTISSVKAVKNISFEVNKGETIGLVGESGCGKTTIGRAILGLEKAASGHVFYEGQDVTLFNSKELKNYWKKVQIIFQDPYSSLNPRMTIGEAIVEPMRIHHLFDNEQQRKAKAHELLETVGLKREFYQRFPHEFSGGQRQRICVARTLAMQPEVIICDESVSALDVSVQAQVLNLLNDLKEQFNLTYIFISHDLSVVKYMSDKIIVMKEGQIVESGTSKNIYENPQEKYTQRLLASVNI